MQHGGGAALHFFTSTVVVGRGVVMDMTFSRLNALRLPALASALLLTGCVVAPERHYRPAPPPPPRMVAVPAPTEPVRGTPVYFYPQQGQSEAQQDRDRYECYRWAVRESGIDPGMTPLRQPVAVAPPPVVRDGAPVVAGAATGAVIGSVLSSSRHGAEGAVLGAIFGAVIGATAQEQRAQAAERTAERVQARNEAAQAATRQPQDNFRRAMAACMAGRGYQVN
jgi:hypothetical protein